MERSTKSGKQKKYCMFVFVREKETSDIDGVRVAEMARNVFKVTCKRLKGSKFIRLIKCCAVGALYGGRILVYNIKIFF